MGLLTDLQGEPVLHRAFGDVDAMRKMIFDNVIKAAQTRYPIENTRYRLELADLGYASAPAFSLREQKQAVIRGGTLEHKLNGTWRLVDKGTGKVIDSKPGVVAHVPYVTSRGTFINNGRKSVV